MYGSPRSTPPQSRHIKQTAQRPLSNQPHTVSQVHFWLKFQEILYKCSFECCLSCYWYLTTNRKKWIPETEMSEWMKQARQAHIQNKTKQITSLATKRNGGIAHRFGIFQLQAQTYTLTHTLTHATCMQTVGNITSHDWIVYACVNMWWIGFHSIQIEFRNLYFCEFFVLQMKYMSTFFLAHNKESRMRGNRKKPVNRVAAAFNAFTLLMCCDWCCAAILISISISHAKLFFCLAISVANDWDRITFIIDYICMTSALII